MVRLTIATFLLTFATNLAKRPQYVYVVCLFVFFFSRAFRCCAQLQEEVIATISQLKWWTMHIVTIICRTINTNTTTNIIHSQIKSHRIPWTSACTTIHRASEYLNGCFRRLFRMLQTDVESIHWHIIFAVCILYCVRYSQQQQVHHNNYQVNHHNQHQHHQHHQHQHQPAHQQNHHNQSQHGMPPMQQQIMHLHQQLGQMSMTMRHLCRRLLETIQMPNSSANKMAT